MPAKSDVTPCHGELARVLRDHSSQFAEAVAQALEEMPKWRTEAQNFAGDRADFLVLHFDVFPQYAAEYFEYEDVTFLQLFIGELIKALYVPKIDDTAAARLTCRVLEGLHAYLETAIAKSLSAESWARFSHFLDEVTRTLTHEAEKVQRVLLVGDCLFLDIVPFIVSDLLNDGIRLVPEYATSKNPVLLRDELRAFSAKKFDMVFFSPFSYEFSLDYNQLLEWRNALKGETAAREWVSRAWEDACGTIDVLADLFDCPIHVHNSAAVIREESRAKRLAKAKVTARNRANGRETIKTLLPAYLQKRNAESFQHLFVFDEQRLVNAIGEIQAGAFFYKTALQHPAVLGEILSRQYADLIYVNAWLLDKKVVVCDLDNTVWDGVIGEGQVTHYHERQRALKALRMKGVVLAINSKNDPANVHWRNGTLSDEDFVCAAVSWEPKVHGMQRIQSALNVKIKDYVFLDDRDDERELMNLSYPDTLCLNATDARVWQRIALWGDLLEDDPDMDRTTMYKQREARKAFIREDLSSPEEQAQLFLALGLRLTVQRAQAHDLKRVAELINRTNQFNLEGSRTTFREASAWHESSDYVILLGQTADRFGEMGVTCVAVAACSTSEMRILVFVLSCRVFGYGIERAVMNHLKEIARQRGVLRIVGKYQMTPQNAPCKDFLSENGFRRQDDFWSIDVNAECLPNPPWLAVTIA